MKERKREAWLMQVAFRELLTRGAGYGAYALDAEQRVAYASPSVLEILGRPAEEVLGRPVAEFIHPQDREKVRQIVDAKLAGEDYPSYTLHLLGPERRSVAVEVLSRRVAGGGDVGEPMIVGLLRRIEGELRAGALLDVLFGIAQDMLSVAEPKAILQRVADAITQHCGFQRAVVALYELSWPIPVDAPVAEVVTAGLSGEEREHLISGGGLSPQQRRLFFSEEFEFSGGARYVPAERNPLSEELGIPGRVSMEGWDAMDMLFVPLYGSDRIIGHISLDDPLEPSAFTPEALRPVVHLAAMASLLVERARERDEVGLHRRHLTLVHRLAPLLLQAGEPAHVIQQAVHLLKEHLGYPFSGGGLVTEGRLEGDEPAGPLTADPEVLTEIGRTLSPHLVRELPPTAATGLGVRSGLVAPVVLEGELVGALEVGSDRPYGVTSLDADTVLAVGGICAAAMRALMVQARLVRLHDLSYVLAQARSREELVERVVRAVRGDVVFDYCAFFRKEGKRLVLEDLSMIAELELNRQVQSGWKIPLGRGVVSWVAENRKAARLGDVRDDPRYVEGCPLIRSELAVPVEAGGELLGVLNVESRRHQAFGPQDEMLLQAVAGQLGVALANMHSQQQLRQMAIRDPLTGLYNRRFLEEAAGHEVAKARRYRRPVAFLYLDVDNFREVNNRFGHRFGDEVLQRVAAYIRENVRDADYVFRLGGDEFLALLPETDGEAYAVVERLKEGFSAVLSDASIDLGLSVGVALWDGEGPFDLDVLLAEADKDMYGNKRIG